MWRIVCCFDFHFFIQKYKERKRGSGRTSEMSISLIHYWNRPRDQFPVDTALLCLQALNVNLCLIPVQVFLGMFR